MPLERRLHDQIGALQQVAQFDQVGADAEVAVIVLVINSILMRCAARSSRLVLRTMPYSST
jgi:hypothetical protein